MSCTNCPICLEGVMLEHDVGYDECSKCDFFAIYDDGRQPPVWTDEEYRAILGNEATSYVAWNSGHFDVLFEDGRFPFPWPICCVTPPVTPAHDVPPKWDPIY